MIFPVPKFEEYLQGKFDFSRVNLCENLSDFYRNSDILGICFEKKDELDDEEYILEVGENGVNIAYACDEGKFRVVTSLRQLAKKNNGNLPFCKISDKPDIKKRSYKLSGSF